MSIIMPFLKSKEETKQSIRHQNSIDSNQAEERKATQQKWTIFHEKGEIDQRAVLRTTVYHSYALNPNP